jgi:SAM-dependent methyltransferase
MSLRSRMIVWMFLAASPPDIRTPAWSDLPAPARALAAQIGIDASNFERTLAAIDLRTSQRLRDGDWDSFIYYILQSRSFTSADPIEPARSAAEYMATQPRQIPPAVHSRIDSFLGAIAAPSNERQRHFASLIPAQDATHELEAQYARAMEFLYGKEVRCRDQGCIADLYKDRGLSTDTSTQAFQTVEAAVAWIRQNRPQVRLRRVLILGPGVDFAPRTALREDSPPRVYQPGQVIQLLHPERVDCADVNPLVVAYARTACASAYEMNLATRFLDASPGWDLVIATNVLLYLDDRELLLAMNNVRRMLNPGGIFIHNDTRFSAELFGKACGLPAIHFGAITLDAQRTPPLTDHYVIHQVAPPAL